MERGSESLFRCAITELCRRKRDVRRWDAHLHVRGTSCDLTVPAEPGGTMKVRCGRDCGTVGRGALGIAVLIRKGEELKEIGYRSCVVSVVEEVLHRKERVSRETDDLLLPGGVTRFGPKPAGLGFDHQGPLLLGDILWYSGKQLYVFYLCAPCNITGRFYTKSAHAGGLASENSNTSIVSLLFLTFSQYHEMQPTISVPTPKTPHKETSRDQCLRCHTLYCDAGWT
jgi:hypothetical protein